MMSTGSAPDPHNEAFIVNKPVYGGAIGVHGDENMASSSWNAFSVDSYKVPTCVGQKTADDVLTVARAVFFLRHHCDLQQLTIDLPAMYLSTLTPVVNTVNTITNNNTSLSTSSTTTTSAPQHLPVPIRITGIDIPLSDVPTAATASSAALSDVASAAATLLSGFLMSVLRQRFNLRAHAHAIKSFLLLSASDFASALLDSSTSLLDGLAHQVTAQHAQPCIDQALRTSTANSLPEDVQGRLLARVLRGGASERGWDVFSMDYVLGDSPLQALFDDKAMTVYRRLFVLVSFFYYVNVLLYVLKTFFYFCNFFFF
jgi:hypothetical protein